MLLDRIANILQHECHIHEKTTLVVGVSGGPDSLCLLHALYQLGYPTIAVHVNHRLRPEADLEAQQIKRFAESIGVNFVSFQIDVNAYAKEESVSIEEAARILRYQSLFEQARKTEAPAVAVGHTADDQVETILMHILRGTGLAGLRGMGFRTMPTAWSDNIPLLRPLLSTWRKEIQRYIEDNHLIPIFDSSNLDVSFLRNRLRHELLPTLQSYNPSICEVLFRMGQSLRDDYSVLEDLSQKAWDATLLKQKKGYLAFRTAGFIQLPLSIQRHTLRRAIASLHPGLRDVDFDCIERGLALLASAKMNSQADLVAGLRLIKKGELFWIANSQVDLLECDSPALPPREVILLPVPSIHLLDHGWRLQVEEISVSELARPWGEANRDPFQAWLDLDMLELPLIARVRKPGDRIKPLGMNGHSIKISDLMINRKLPKISRDSWPVICSGSNIIWIPGYRISELAQVKPGTSRVIHLSLFRDRTT